MQPNAYTTRHARYEESLQEDGSEAGYPAGSQVPSADRALPFLQCRMK